jgi:hypothetical protein
VAERITSAGGIIDDVVDPLIEPAVLAELCGDIAALLRAELEAGNNVEETSRGWPATLNVWLSYPFRARAVVLPEHVTRRDVNDPHYWLAEYLCTKHDHLLACKYAP